MFKEGRTGTEKLPTSDSHVDGEKGTKTIVYNTKRDQRKKERGRRKKENTEKKREQKVEEIQQ